MTDPITVHGTDLPPGVYDAEVDEVRVHTPNTRYQLRTTTPNPSYDPDRPICPRIPCMGEEDGCDNVTSEPAWRLTRRGAEVAPTHGAWMEAGITYLSPSDIARGAMKSVAWENAAIKAWNGLSDDERGEAQRIVNAALLRLLTAGPGWMPGAITTSPGRLEIRIAVEWGDYHNEGVRARATMALARESQRARRGLRQLAADMEEGDEDAPST